MEVSGVTPWDHSQLQREVGQCVCKYLLPTAHLAPCPHPPGCLSGLEVSHTLHLLLSSPLSLCFFSCLFLFLNKQDAKYLFSMHFFPYLFTSRCYFNFIFSQHLGLCWRESFCNSANAELLTHCRVIPLLH